MLCIHLVTYGMLFIGLMQLAHSWTWCTGRKWMRFPQLSVGSRDGCWWAWAGCSGFTTWARRNSYASVRTRCEFLLLIHYFILINKFIQILFRTTPVFQLLKFKSWYRRTSIWFYIFYIVKFNEDEMAFQQLSFSEVSSYCSKIFHSS